MSEPYKETLAGATVLRHGPGPRHELICDRLHDAVKAGAGPLTGIRILERRAKRR